MQAMNKCWKINVRCVIRNILRVVTSFHESIAICHKQIAILSWKGLIILFYFFRVDLDVVFWRCKSMFAVSFVNMWANEEHFYWFILGAVRKACSSRLVQKWLSVFSDDIVTFLCCLDVENSVDTSKLVLESIFSQAQPSELVKDFKLLDDKWVRHISASDF